MTNNKHEYQAKVRAQLETWAATPHAEGRFFAVTGTLAPESANQVVLNGAPRSKDQDFLDVTPCHDDWGGIACKEGHLLDTGFERGAEWLVILGEDNYVDTAQLEHWLGTVTDPDQPVVFGSWGCGLGTKDRFCPEVSAKGGLCGGGGYALNRAALEAIFRDGREAVHAEYNRRAGQAGDMATSCVLMSHGMKYGVNINMVDGKFDYDKLVGNRVMRRTELLDLMATGPMTFHYLSPEVMRWMHAELLQRNGAQGAATAGNTSQLEAEAFDRGCCCWFDQDQKRECQSIERMPVNATWFVLVDRGVGNGRIVDLKRLHLQHIAERALLLDSGVS